MGVEHAVRQYYVGDRVLTEGERGSEIFILLSGELEVTRGRVRLGVLRNKGDVIGEIAALANQPRSATVTVKTDAELLCVKIEFKAVSAKLPDIFDKIDAAVRMRYEIARNKTLLYTRRAAEVSRGLLHEVMVRAEQLRVGKKVPEPQIRKAMRRRLEDLLSLHGEMDNPRVFRKIADEYGVLNEYQRELDAQSWLDDRLILKLEDIENATRLLADEKSLRSLKTRAELTAQTLDLLSEYEQTPGTIRELELAHLEQIIPLSARAHALRDVLVDKEEDPDSARLSYIERKVQSVVELAKINAGQDTPSLLRDATDLKVLREYERELRRVLELTGTSSSTIEPRGL